MKTQALLHKNLSSLFTDNDQISNILNFAQIILLDDNLNRESLEKELVNKIYKVFKKNKQSEDFSLKPRDFKEMVHQMIIAMECQRELLIDYLLFECIEDNYRHLGRPVFLLQYISAKIEKAYMEFGFIKPDKICILFPTKDMQKFNDIQKHIYNANSINIFWKTLGIAGIVFGIYLSIMDCFAENGPDYYFQLRNLLVDLLPC